MHIYDRFSIIDTYDYDSFYKIMSSQRSKVIRRELNTTYTPSDLHNLNISDEIPNNFSILIDDWQFDIFLIL